MDQICADKERRIEMGEDINQSTPLGYFGTNDPRYQHSQEQAEGENPGGAPLSQVQEESSTNLVDGMVSTGPTPGQIKAMEEWYEKWMRNRGT
jgi:hypothetical protein